MMMKKAKTLQSGVLGVLMVALQSAWCATLDQPPPPLREFRGAWIATVSNIDWPSKPGLTSAQQQTELIAILDTAARLKLNALFLQVRPACDALYQSKIEPWSEYLTGEQNSPPNPYYDPLEFAVTQAHRRGLELHAWFNPFRARQSSAKSAPSASHVSRRYPKLVKAYGSYLWLDPGEPLAQDYSTAVILDVVRRYDIDGVHLDDYFYPYQKTNTLGQAIDFPDESSWQQFKASGGSLSRSDWRRRNVDEFVRKLYLRIKEEKRWVKFGISPFGIWRPGYPPQIVGLDAYAEIFADSRKWMLNGWADYFSPQLYWPVASKKQSFQALLDWWADQNSKQRHLWPGMRSEKVGKDWTASEIIDQVQRTRKQTGASGHVHWNVSALMTPSRELNAALLKDAYVGPALVPASPWLDNKPPAKPKAYFEKNQDSDTTTLHWENGGRESVWLWILQTKVHNRWSTEILPGARSAQIFGGNSRHASPEQIAISAVDRCGNMGPTETLNNAPPKRRGTN